MTLTVGEGLLARMLRGWRLRHDRSELLAAQTLVATGHLSIPWSLLEIDGDVWELLFAASKILVR
jgi:hypothetical protein